MGRLQCGLAGLRLEKGVAALQNLTVRWRVFLHREICKASTPVERVCFVRFCLHLQIAGPEVEVVPIGSGQHCLCRGEEVSSPDRVRSASNFILLDLVDEASLEHVT